NILQSSFLAMHQSIEQLHKKPELLLIDGNRFLPYLGIAHQCIIGGDAQYMSIAAASILAKTYRDEFMKKIHEEHPEYDWQTNKGYPTKAHKCNIEKHGLSPYHRLTFRSERTPRVKKTKRGR